MVRVSWSKPHCREPGRGRSGWIERQPLSCLPTLDGTVSVARHATITLTLKQLTFPTRDLISSVTAKLEVSLISASIVHISFANHGCGGLSHDHGGKASQTHKSQQEKASLASMQLLPHPKAQMRWHPPNLLAMLCHPPTMQLRLR